MLLALLQPAPETFDLFDDIMLLSEGESHGDTPSCCLLRNHLLEELNKAPVSLNPTGHCFTRKVQELWCDKCVQGSSCGVCVG